MFSNGTNGCLCLHAIIQGGLREALRLVLEFLGDHLVLALAVGADPAQLQFKFLLIQISIRCVACIQYLILDIVVH